MAREAGRFTIRLTNPGSKGLRVASARRVELGIAASSCGPGRVSRRFRMGGFQRQSVSVSKQCHAPRFWRVVWVLSAPTAATTPAPRARLARVVLVSLRVAEINEGAPNSGLPHIMVAVSVSISVGVKSVPRASHVSSAIGAKGTTFRHSQGSRNNHETYWKPDRASAPMDGALQGGVGLRRGQRLAPADTRASRP
jgi:hypothetical protein